MENNCRILADGHTISNDTWKTGLNNNDLVIGPSGSGKTRGYVLPNILQCTESMAVTDTKGALCSDVRPILEQEGYKVVELNLADCAASPYGYDPLDGIRYGGDGRFSEQEILTLAAGLIPIENPREPYWEQMARVCLESMAAYVLEALPEREHSLTSVVRLSGELGRKGKYRALMRELEAVAPDSFALSRYRLFRSVAEDADRTAACIFSFLTSKLAPFGFDGAGRFLSNPQKLNIRRLGRKKTAVFLTISDTDTSLYRLADVFYTQALHTLCALADRNPGHRLGVPVRFYLYRGNREHPGASAMLDTPVLEEFAAGHGDLYILPSSIFEVLLVPVADPYSTDPAFYTDMVRDVNRTQVEPEEVLSDNVYLYHADTGVIDIPE